MWDQNNAFGDSLAFEEVNVQYEQATSLEKTAEIYKSNYKTLSGRPDISGILFTKNALKKYSGCNRS